MRGLPPPPADVAELRFFFDVNGYTASVVHWMFVPSLEVATVPGLESLASNVLFYALPFFTDLMHAGARVDRLSLQTFTVTPVNMVVSASPNHGAWTGGQSAAVALGLHWLTGEGGAGDHVVTHVPAMPDVFIEDGQLLNALGLGNAGSAASAFLNGIATIVGPVGGTCSLGTVHRQKAGLALPASIFSPFVGVIVTRKLTTIRRRVLG